MVNYKNGKIYKIEPICDHAANEIYIGSSAEKLLCRRIAKHKCDYNYWKQDKKTKSTSFTLFDKYGVDMCKIILIENYPCDTKEELLAREAYYINSIIDCVNKYIPLRTKKEYWVK